MHRRTSAWRARLRRHALPLTALVLALLIGGGSLAAASWPGRGNRDQVSCAPGVDLIVRADGTWSCGQRPNGSSPTSPAPSPSSSPSASAPAPTPSASSSTGSPSTPTTPAGPSATRPNSGMTNCMTKLAECGYMHPGNTGVPAGVSLTAYTGPSRITTAGTVIDGKTTGCLEIAATNVVIRNSKISGPCAFAVKTSGGGSVTVQDSEIDCVNYKGMGVAGSNATTLRSEIRRCENGFHVNSNVVIQDNYITEVVEVDGGHGDGVQASSGSNVTIRHNTFNLRNPITSSMIMDELVINNLLVEDNFFSAGAYTIYCPDSGSNMVYRNNRFYGPVGQWNSDPNRPAFGFRTNCGNATWTGNYRDDTLAAVS